jgi:DNA repair exonuclease SbcCD nuclease subunit
MAIRFLHTSDLQLGMTRWYLSQDAQHRFTQDRIDAIRRMGALASEHNAQFMVVAGDVFESNQVAAQTVQRALKAFESVPVPVFLLPGNHDPLDAGSVYKHKTFIENCPGHVRVIRDSEPLKVPGLDQVEVVGAPWFGKHPLSDLVADLSSRLNPALGFRVAVGHGAVSTLSPDAFNPAVIDLQLVQEAISAGKLQYLALGDRHSATNVDTGVHYSGAPVATDFDEVDSGRCLVVELEHQVEPNITPVQVSDWRFVNRDWDVGGPEDVAAFRDWLDGFTTPERTVLQFGFTGTLSVADHAALVEAREHAESLFAGVRFHERTSDLAVMPDQADADSIGLTGYERAAWLDLSEQARTGDAAARDALALFYRLAREGA